MRFARTAALALAAALLDAGASAQHRRARRPGCTVVHHTLAQVDDDRVDPSTAPALVFTPDGALATWRERDGALKLVALDAQWRPVGAPREVARPAGAFALAGTPSGAVLAYVEREREVVLARVNARGEAQNVPRLLAREAGFVESVAVTRTGAGLLAAWVVADGHALRGVSTDPRGVPRGAAAELGTGRAPRLAWLPALGAAALFADAAAPGDEPSLLSLGPGGEVNARLRWPAATLGPVELSGSLYAVQAHGTGAPLLVRVPPGGAAVAPAEAEARARYALTAVADNGDVVAALVHDAEGPRQLLGRASADGSDAAPVVLRTGPAVPSTLAVRADGAAFVAHREAGPHGAARVVATEVTCAR